MGRVCQVRFLANKVNTLQGTVKKVITRRGYGFIDTDDIDEDVFFHHSNLMNADLERVEIGEVVEFEVEETPKGPNAVNIWVIE